MQVNKKWLLAAPALGAVLVLGPLAQKRGQQSNNSNAPAAALMEPAGGTPSATAVPQGPAPTAQTRPKIEVGANAVAMPEPWQVLSTLAGLLILAGIAVLVLNRVRKNPSRPTSTILSMRQSLRLGSKTRVHAVQFDDRLLLLGESEAGVTLLQEINDPQIAEDEDDVLGRYVTEQEADRSDAEDLNQGAEPRDMGLIAAARQLAASRLAAQQQAQKASTSAPRTAQGKSADKRPANLNAQRKADKRSPQKSAGKRTAPAADPVLIPRPEQANDTATGNSSREDALNDFRALLRRAKAEKVS